MKYTVILSVLLVTCLLASTALAAQNGKALQNGPGIKNGNCGESCKNTNCPYGNQDGLGNQNKYGQADDKGQTAQNGLAAQKGNRGENCNNPACPYGNQDDLGNQYGKQCKGKSNGACDGDRDQKRDGSCQNNRAA